MQKTLFDSDKVRKSLNYPHIFPLSLTHPEFPADDTVSHQMGMPLGCVLCPFTSMEDRSQAFVDTPRFVDSGTKIARCGSCSAYINPFCEASPMRWFCSLCGARNGFTRSMTRYRQVDLRLLPETQNLVMDYPMPFRQIDGFKETTKMSIASSERPLVHIFLIQESMAVDAMQAVVDSLTTAIKAMHPDVHIALLTFSHRIGIHRFVTSRHYPTVQYVHMATNDGQGTIFEGHVLPELSHDPANMSVKTTIPLSSAADFFDVAFRVGSHREAILAAVSALFDSFSGVDEGTAYGNGSVPHVLVGPTLEAVSEWLMYPSEAVGEDIPAGQASAGNGISGSDGSSNASSKGLLGAEGLSWATLLSSLQRLSVSLLGDSEETMGMSECDGASAAATGAGQTSGSTGGDIAQAPVDICSGIVLHLFASSPQDLPPSSHPSAPAIIPERLTGVSPKSRSRLSLSGGAGWPIGLDESWVKALAAKIGQRGICMNLWAVCSFAGQDADLLALAPLAMQTGGQIQRCVLGICPKDERVRMAEQLRRAVTQQLATKAVLKLRTPTVMRAAAEGGKGALTGPGFHDPELPGVYRLPACSPTSSVVYELEFKRADRQQVLKSLGNSVVLQFAFSYDTLVETNQPAQESGRTLSSTSESADNADGNEGNVDNAEPDQSSVDRSKSGLASRKGTEAVKKASSFDREYVDGVLGVLDMGDSVEQRQQAWRQQRRRARENERQRGTPSRRRSRSDRPAGDDDDEAVLTMDVIDALRQSKGEQFADRCVYNRANSLVAVRRLRIITIIIECTDKIPRLMQFSHPATIAMMVARQAYTADLQHKEFSQPSQLTLGIKTAGAASASLSSPSSSTSPKNTSKALGFFSGSRVAAEDGATVFGGLQSNGVAKIYDEALPLVHAATSYVLRQKKLKSPMTREDIRMAVDETLSHAGIVSVLKSLFGALSLLGHLHSQARSLDSGEEAVVMISLLQHLDAHTAHRIFYPQLVPMDRLNVLEKALLEKPLALQREAMLFASAGPQGETPYGFLLDAGVELVLYRNVATQFENTHHEAKKVTTTPNRCDSGIVSTVPSLSPSTVIFYPVGTTTAAMVGGNDSSSSSSNSNSAGGDAGKGGASLPNGMVPPPFPSLPSSIPSSSSTSSIPTLTLPHPHSQSVSPYVVTGSGITSGESGAVTTGGIASKFTQSAPLYSVSSALAANTLAPVRVSMPSLVRPAEGGDSGRTDADTDKTTASTAIAATFYGATATAGEVTDTSIAQSPAAAPAAAAAAAGTATSESSEPEQAITSPTLSTPTRCASGSEEGVDKIGSHLLWTNALVNDLERRLSVSGAMVPRAYLSEAGTSTAGYLTSNLIEDNSKCGGASLSDFLRFIRARVIESFEEDM